MSITRVEQQPCFILHARAYRETSVLLECLSRDHGRVGLVARGVRRERTRTPRALLQPFTPVTLGWTGRGELSVMTAIDGAGAPIALTGSALICALYMNELVARLTPRHDPHPPLFADYAQALQRLTSDEQSHAWTLRRFERDLLVHIGYGLVLDIDAASGEPLDAESDYVYRYEQGPLLWHHGMQETRVRGAALLALAQDRMPDAGSMGALRRLMRAAISAHLDGSELHAWTMLGGLRNR